MQTEFDIETERKIAELSRKRFEEFFKDDAKLAEIKADFREKYRARVSAIKAACEKKTRTEFMREAIKSFRMSACAAGAPTMPSEDTEPNRVIRFQNEIRKA